MSRNPQNRQLTEIRDRLNHKELISHMLNVKVSKEPTDQQNALALRTELQLRIRGVVSVENVLHNGVLFPTSITWEMPPAAANSAYYYYAVNLPYVDSVIALHTRTFLAHICDNIRANFPQFGTNWRISYLIAKPVTRFAPIPQQCFKTSFVHNSNLTESV